MEYSLTDATLDLSMQVVNGMFKGFVFGGIGYVFITILIAQDSIFSFYRPFIQRLLFGKCYNKMTPFRMKLDQVLTQCNICFSGQLAFWFYLLDFKGFFGWAACVCFSILFSKILNKL